MCFHHREIDFKKLLWANLKRLKEEQNKAPKLICNNKKRSVLANQDKTSIKMVLSLVPAIKVPQFLSQNSLMHSSLEVATCVSREITKFCKKERKQLEDDGGIQQ